MSDSTDLVIQTPPMAQLAPIGDPAEFVASYIAVADELARVVRSKKLASTISGREYVRVEGWTLLGSMLGVFAVSVWTRPVDVDGERVGWEARCEARTRDGGVVGAAEAECLRSEAKWKSRDDYALRSMAQTRATSKALRQPLGFVMTLAGLEATPAEEMPRDDSTAPSGEYTLPFGKHKGVPLADVPADYLEWVIGSSKDAGAREHAQAELASRNTDPVIEADYDEEDIPF